MRSTVGIPFLFAQAMDEVQGGGGCQYDFGDGVMVIDASGWEYTTPGNERTRKVYVETTNDDAGPAHRMEVNFTVRFDPATGSLSEAYASDNKGQFWGKLPTKESESCLHANVSSTSQWPVEKSPANPAHQGTLHLGNAASPALRERVLDLVYTSDGIERIEGEFVVARHRKTNVAIVVVDGDFNRDIYKKAIGELTAKQLRAGRMYVYADTATYSGRGISFSKLEEIGIER